MLSGTCDPLFAREKETMKIGYVKLATAWSMEIAKRFFATNAGSWVYLGLIILLSLCGGIAITALSFFIGIGLISFIPIGGKEIKPELVITTVILIHTIYMLIIGGLVRYVWKREKIKSWFRPTLLTIVPLVSPYLLLGNGYLIWGILIVLASLVVYDALTTHINHKGS